MKKFKKQIECGFTNDGFVMVRINLAGGGEIYEKFSLKEYNHYLLINVTENWRKRPKFNIQAFALDQTLQYSNKYIVCQLEIEPNDTGPVISVSELDKEYSVTVLTPED